MSYFELNLYFLAPALALAIWLLRQSRFRAVVPAALVLLVITAIFDNFIVGSGIVGYDSELISGVFIGFAPIEDFAYSLVAAVLIPAGWYLSRSK